MKILVVCQHYYPEPFRITDICEELVKKGHEITVVTGTPNYPMGEIYKGYEHGKRAEEIVRGVRIIRCPIHPRKQGVLHRIWNYYSYPKQSKRAVRRLKEKFDVVFINQLSPIMMAEAGIWYAKKHNIKSVLYCLDLWPASLGVGGISKGILYKWFHKVSKKIYRSVDKILISSRSFSQYFEDEFGLYNTIYLPQYAEGTFTPADCMKMPDENIDLMFAGNVGTAQSVNTIIRAAALCKDVQNLRWHIVGDGKEYYACKKLAEELEAPVIFHGRKTIEEMPHYYAMADAMLVTMQKNPVISLTLPGKVQSYMAAGKPIIGAIDGETNAVIRESGCGFCCNAEDFEGLAKCVRNFVQCAEKEKFALNAVQYNQEYFERENNICSLERFIKAESE